MKIGNVQFFLKKLILLMPPQLKRHIILPLSVSLCMSVPLWVYSYST